MSILKSIYKILKSEAANVWAVVKASMHKAWSFIAKYVLKLWGGIAGVVNTCYKKVAEMSLEAQVFISLSMFLCIFLFWQFMPYYVPQAVFVMVNLLLVIISSAFTCYVIFSANKKISSLKETIDELEQIKKDKDQEIRGYKSEIHDLNMASRKQQSFGKNSQVLIDTVKKNRQEKKEEDPKGQFLLKSLAQCSDICCGLIYMKKDDEDVFEIAGQYALSNCEIVEDPNLKEVTVEDALFGQVIKTGQMLHIADVPSESLTIMSGLGQTESMNVYILPIKKNNKVVAMAEVSSFSRLAVADIWKDIDNVLLDD